MSHIVTIKTEVRDAAAIRAACTRLNLPAPVEGKFELFSEVVSGIAVQLADWTYPIVCDVTRGDLKYDNFGERWGKQTELDRFLQAYAVERARLEARKKGHTVTEQQLADGSIRLTVQVSGGAA